MLWQEWWIKHQVLIKCCPNSTESSSVFFKTSFFGRRLALWFPIQARQTNHFNCSAKWNDPLKWWQGCVYWATVLIGPCGSSQKIQPYKCARLGCGHPSPGPKGGGNRVESNRTTLRGNWQQLHCAYWQSPPSVKTTQGQESWSWFRAAYQANHFLEPTWLTAALICPHMCVGPREARESQRSFKCMMISSVLDGFCGWFRSNE